MSSVRTTTPEQLAQASLNRNNTLSLRGGIVRRRDEEEELARIGLARVELTRINNEAVVDSARTNLTNGSAGIRVNGGAESRAVVERAANIRPISTRPLDSVGDTTAGDRGMPELNLRDASPPRVELNPRLLNGAESFARNLERVANNVLVDRNLAMPRLRNVDELSADQLLAEFLKVNINDPNNNVATHNKMYEFATNMRQLAIEEAQKKIKVAQELMREAQALADKVSAMQDMMAIMGPVMAMMGPMGGIMAAAMQVAVAAAELQATNKMLDAKEQKNNAERFKLMAEMHQDQIKDQGEVMKQIMESKNQLLDAVMAMMNASFVSQQKLLSATMARG